MVELSEGMPKDAASAGAYIFTVTKPTLDDLKVMVMLEAAGKVSMTRCLPQPPNEAVRALLAKNGQEEMGHAHRVVRVIKQVFGVDFAIPSPEENPYAMGSAGITVSKDMLNGITQGEIAGEGLYESWAVALGDEEAARQLRQNGKEERGHGERAQQAVALL